MTPLPDLLHTGTAILLATLGIGLVTAHTLLAAFAAQRAPLAPRRRLLLPVLVGAFLSIWFGAVLAFEREALSLLGSASIAAGPMVAAAALLFTSTTLRRVNAAMPAHWLIWIQMYRMVGLIFLYPYLYYGLVPPGFAIPAGAGDFLTVALVPVVAHAVARGRPHATAWAVAWNVFGLIDLIVAPAAAVLTQAQVLEMHPISLVPLFIGPPVGILTHIYSLRNLAAAAHARTEGARLETADRLAQGITGALHTT